MPTEVWGENTGDDYNSVTTDGDLSEFAGTGNFTADGIVCAYAGVSDRTTMIIKFECVTVSL